MSFRDVGQFIVDMRAARTGNSKRMNDYQKQSAFLSRYKEEQASALLEIANIDTHANIMAKQGQDPQPYLQRFTELFKQWAPERIVDGQIVSNVDAAKIAANRLKQQADNLDNKVNITKSKIEQIYANKKLSLTEKKAQAGELVKEIELDRKIHTGEIASGAQQLATRVQSMTATQNSLGKSIHELLSRDTLTPAQETELARLIQMSNDLSDDIRNTNAAFGQPLPEDTSDKRAREGLEQRAAKVGLPVNSTEADITLAEQLANSKSEKGKGSPPPSRSSSLGYGQGTAIKRAIGSGLHKAIEIPAEGANYFEQSVAGIPDLLLGAVGAPALPTPDAVTNKLSDWIYKLFYKKNAEQANGGSAAPTNINEQLLSGVK